jgi:hypothetical protein
MMKKWNAALALAALALPGCSALATQTAPPADELATRVSGTLTSLPPAITLPPETVAPPTIPAEIAPTATLEPTAAPPTEVPPTATFTPEPSVTPLPSFTPLATQTLTVGDPRAQLGNPAWRDPFDNGGNWPLGEDSFTRAEVEDGDLVMTGRTTTDGWRLTWPEVQDFYLEMSVETGSCTGNDHYGLIARVPDLHEASQGYLFGVSCDGRYSLRTWDGETMTSLIPLTASASIVAGSDKTNRLGLLADGDRLVLYANGVQLREFQDDTFTEAGSFGIFVGARQTSEFTIRVSEIAYWENP